MHIGHAIAEDEIISQCKKGSLKHQEMMYKLFYAYAMGISLRYSVTREDALEVVNDAFIKVFKSISSYTDDKPFKPWLRRVLVNTAIDRRRKELKYQLNTGLENAETVYTGNTVIENLNAQDILQLMKMLPATQLTVFNLYEIDGYTHDEIAQLLAITPGSSRVYLARAKERLRNLLSKQVQ